MLLGRDTLEHEELLEREHGAAHVPRVRRRGGPREAGFDAPLVRRPARPSRARSRGSPARGPPRAKGAPPRPAPSAPRRRRCARRAAAPSAPWPALLRVDEGAPRSNVVLHEHRDALHERAERLGLCEQCPGERDDVRIRRCSRRRRRAVEGVAGQLRRIDVSRRSAAPMAMRAPSGPSSRGSIERTARPNLSSAMSLVRGRAHELAEGGAERAERLGVRIRVERAEQHLDALPLPSSPEPATRAARLSHTERSSGRAPSRRRARWPGRRPRILGALGEAHHQHEGDALRGDRLEGRDGVGERARQVRRSSRRAAR